MKKKVCSIALVLMVMSLNVLLVNELKTQDIDFQEKISTKEPKITPGIFKRMGSYLYYLVYRKDPVIKDTEKRPDEDPGSPRKFHINMTNAFVEIFFEPGVVLLHSKIDLSKWQSFLSTLYNVFLTKTVEHKISVFYNKSLYFIKNYNNLWASSKYDLEEINNLVAVIKKVSEEIAEIKESVEDNKFLPDNNMLYKITFGFLDVLKQVEARLLERKQSVSLLLEKDEKIVKILDSLYKAFIQKDSPNLKINFSVAITSVRQFIKDTYASHWVNTFGYAQGEVQDYLNKINTGLLNVVESENDFKALENNIKKLKALETELYETFHTIRASRFIKSFNGDMFLVLIFVLDFVIDYGQKQNLQILNTEKVYKQAANRLEKIKKK